MIPQSPLRLFTGVHVAKEWHDVVAWTDLAAASTRTLLGPLGDKGSAKPAERAGSSGGIARGQFPVALLAFENDLLVYEDAGCFGVCMDAVG